MNEEAVCILAEKTGWKGYIHPRAAKICRETPMYLCRSLLNSSGFLTLDPKVSLAAIDAIDAIKPEDK